MTGLGTSGSHICRFNLIHDHPAHRFNIPFVFTEGIKKRMFLLSGAGTFRPTGAGKVAIYRATSNPVILKLRQIPRLSSTSVMRSTVARDDLPCEIVQLNGLGEG